MTNVNKLSALATIAVLAGFSASADTGEGWVWGANPDVITVLSNGKEYTNMVNQGAIAVNAKLNYDTGSVGGVKSWWAKPKMVAGFGIAAEADMPTHLTKKQSYGALERPRSIHPNLTFAVPYVTVKPLAESACYFKAENLKGQGMSKKQVFSKDRYVHIDVSLHYNVQASGAGSNNPIFEYWAPYKLQVKCAKWNGPSIPTPNTNIASAPKVEKAVMLIDPVSGGPRNLCKIKTNTTIKTDRPNVKVKYRFVHSNGSKSNVFTTTTSANGLQVVKHDWDIPVVKGPEKGWVRIEGVSPSFKTNKAHYNMNCSSAGGLTIKKPGKGSLKTTLKIKK